MFYVYAPWKHTLRVPFPRKPWSLGPLFDGAGQLLALALAGTIKPLSRSTYNLCVPLGGISAISLWHNQPRSGIRLPRKLFHYHGTTPKATQVGYALLSKQGPMTRVKVLWSLNDRLATARQFLEVLSSKQQQCERHKSLTDGSIEEAFFSGRASRWVTGEQKWNRLSSWHAKGETEPLGKELRAKGTTGMGTCQEGGRKEDCRQDGGEVV